LSGVYWSYWSQSKYQSSVDGEKITFENYPFTNNFDTNGFKDNRSDFRLIVETGITYDNLGSGLLSLDVCCKPL